MALCVSQPYVHSTVLQAQHYTDPVALWARRGISYYGRLKIASVALLVCLQWAKLMRKCVLSGGQQGQHDTATHTQMLP